MSLHEQLKQAPQTLAIVEAVLNIWPEHLGYITKSFAGRDSKMLETTEKIASAARQLMAGQEQRFAQDYKLTCERVRAEEIFFYREGRYRLSSFEEANREVYANAAYMREYMNGLLLTQILWCNHTAIFEMFMNRVIGAATQDFDYLEIGPGHGLGIAFAAEATKCRSLEAWDVSETSIEETRNALHRLGVQKPVRLELTNIFTTQLPQRKFDLVVIAEVLEHLEEPQRALEILHNVINDTGRLFITVPLNSPAPDHIYLLRSPEEVTALVQAAGFSIDSMELYATQGRDLKKAFAAQMTVVAGVIARPA